MYSVYLIDYDPNPGARPPEPPKREKLYIYDQLTHDEGMMLTEPELDIAASSAGSFSFNLPKTNYGYGKILKTITRVVVEKDDKIIFMGRINSDDEDLWQNQRIKAEGALTYLNDSLSEKRVFINKDRTQENRLTVYKLAEEILNYHNNKFPDEPWKQFHVVPESDIPVQNRAKFVGRDSENVNSDAISYYSINYDNPLELLQEIVELADGAFRIKYNEDEGYWDVYIYGKFNFPVNNSQPIEFGLNLLDLAKTNDNSNVATVVAPFGGDLVQRSKAIGEAIAGFQMSYFPEGVPVPQGWTNTYWAMWYPDSIYVHDPANWYYTKHEAHDVGGGYWVFKLSIDQYNQRNPSRPLKKLYISWRGYKFTTGPDEEAGEGKLEDCAWRVYDSVGNTLGYRAFNTPGFDSAIDEEIDLSNSEYYGATTIWVSGWGLSITPMIYRDTDISEENDKLTIEKCDEFIDVDGFTHYAGSPYLISNDLVEKYGVIEKKIEYDIADTIVPISGVITPSTGSTALGCFAGNASEDPNPDADRGNYQIIPFGDSGYSTIQYELPDHKDPSYPRGIFITCRMHYYGIYDWDNKHWLINGMYAVYDGVWQLLGYKEANIESMGKSFNTVVNEYIDLSDAKYYGAKYIRAGNWGDGVTFNVVPSDDIIQANRLLAQAELYLTNYQWEKTVIEATAVDLNMTDDSWEALDICTNVAVYSVNYYFPITSLTTRLDDFSQNKVILGYDNEEYITTQLSQEQRLLSVQQSLEERRTKQ